MITLLLVVMAPQLGLSVITPSFVLMAQDLHVNVTNLQWTTTVYMVGYALSMFIGGLLAERCDAVKLQAFGLAMFSLGSILCALSPSILFLAVGRFLQALGGTSATVLCRLIIRRRIEPGFRISPLANLTMVISLTPAIAPLLGGMASLIVPWRMVFAALAILGFFFSLLCIKFLGKAEPEEPNLLSIKDIITSVRLSLSNFSYLWYATALALVWMSYFGFLALSPAFFNTNYGISGIIYGLLMILPAVGYWFGSFLIKHTNKTTHLAHFLIYFSSIIACVTVSACIFTGRLPMWLAVAFLCVQFIGVGSTIPYTQNGQLSLPIPFPGVSTGLFFFIQMMSGAVYAALANFLGINGFRSVLAYVAAPQILLGAILMCISIRNTFKKDIG